MKLGVGSSVLVKVRFSPVTKAGRLVAQRMSTTDSTVDASVAGAPRADDRTRGTAKTPLAVIAEDVIAVAVVVQVPLFFKQEEFAVLAIVYIVTTELVTTPVGCMQSPIN
jgi:hypothetical protein